MQPSWYLTFSLFYKPSGIFIATILGEIQRAHEHQRRGSPTCGLHIRIFSLGELVSIIGLTSSVRTLSALDVEVRVALQQLCTSAGIDTLELRNLFDVPNELVLFSSAATLVISDVSFSPNFMGKFFADLPFKNTRRLAVHNSPSFLHIVSDLHAAHFLPWKHLNSILEDTYARGTLDAWARLREKTTLLRIGIHEGTYLHPARRPTHRVHD